MPPLARRLLGLSLLLTALSTATSHAQDGRLRERLRARLAQAAAAPQAPLPAGEIGRAHV